MQATELTELYEAFKSIPQFTDKQAGKVVDMIAGTADQATKSDLVKLREANKADIKEHTAEIRSTIVNMQTNFDTMQKTIVAMQKDIVAMQKDIVAMQKNTATMQINFDTMQKTIIAMQNNFDAMQKEIARGRVEIEKRITNLSLLMIMLTGVTIAALGFIMKF